jgi:hypothetical protein
MANYDYVFVDTGLPADQAASSVHRVVATHVGADPDAPGRVTWPTPGGKMFTAHAKQNWLGGPDELEPDDIVAYAGYDTMVEVRMVGGAADAQLAEARKLFDAVRASQPERSALLVHGLDLLIAAWHQGRLTDFPERTSAYSDDRALWEPVVVPYERREA